MKTAAWAVFIPLLSATLGAQGLADVAKAEAKRRESTPKAEKTYSGDDRSTGPSASAAPKNASTSDLPKGIPAEVVARANALNEEISANAARHKEIISDIKQLTFEIQLRRETHYQTPEYRAKNDSEIEHRERRLKVLVEEGTGIETKIWNLSEGRNSLLAPYKKP